MENNRAVALYRASTKQQTNKDNNDIPTQKQIVRDFIFKNEWNLIREFTEGGISGFKQSEKDRDALQAIKQMAVNEEFDILVVYMSDRIGRIADETPLVISFLNQHGVRVVSTVDGEIKTETHTDKLMTYLRYWQNEGESLKTRQRVTDYHMAAIEEGRYRGGSFIPLGYKLVDNGSKNFKGRHILDFVINEETAKIVKLIYKLSIENNYGQSRIAQYLNKKGYTPPKSKAWYSTTIQSILNNPIYKGQMRFNSKVYDKQILSPVQEDLIIIPENEWNKNQEVMKARTYKKNSKTQEDRRVKNTHGCLLFSGIIFCGYCGMSLTTMTSYARWTTKNGEKKKTIYHKYRCGSFYKKGQLKCEGQSTYGISKIEPPLIKYIKQVILEVQKEEINTTYIQNLDKQINELIKNKEKTKREIKDLYREINVLENEIPKALLKESNFSPEMLNKILNEKNNLVDTKDKQINEIEQKIKDININKEDYINFGFNINKWEKEFDNGDFETKKQKIREVVSKIVVKKDGFDITYNLPVQKYKEFMSCKDTNGIRVPRVELQPIKFTRTYKIAS